MNSFNYTEAAISPCRLVPFLSLGLQLWIAFECSSDTSVEPPDNNEPSTHGAAEYLNIAQSQSIRETPTSANDSSEPTEYYNVEDRYEANKKPETAIDVSELTDRIFQPDFLQVLDLQFKVNKCLLG